MSDMNIQENIVALEERIRLASLKRSEELKQKHPFLVTVSKTHPKELIIKAYESGLREFGENYVQELYGKATDEEIQRRCPDIRWHFIGLLQRNKINKLTAVPNLHMVQTVHSLDLALALNHSWQKLNKEPLEMLLQVNTSGEKEKSGCKPEDVATLYTRIRNECPCLYLRGLMTIGKYDNYDPVEGINPDFKCLLECRQKLVELHRCNMQDIELSMGMSGDFEHAIEVGATIVRVGTAVFGPRNMKVLNTYKSLQSQD